MRLPVLGDSPFGRGGFWDFVHPRSEKAHISYIGAAQIAGVRGFPWEEFRRSVRKAASRRKPRSGCGIYLLLRPPCPGSTIRTSGRISRFSTPRPEKVDSSYIWAEISRSAESFAIAISGSDQKALAPDTPRSGIRIYHLIRLPVCGGSGRWSGRI